LAGFQNTGIFGEAGSAKTGKSDFQGSAGASPPCPQCGSKKLWRDGLRYSPFGDSIQRWLCRNCGFRFSDSDDVQRALSAFERVERVDTKAVKGRGDKALECQICVKETKNLATTELKTVAGESKTTDQEVKGKILEFAFHLRKQGRVQGTIISYRSVLNSLITEGANLFKPESVKEALALNETWNNTTKTTKTIVYDRFADFLGLKWEKPKYKAQKKLPFIPTEQEIDSLIAASPKKTATILQLLKETGARIGEACKLEWIDLNEKAMTITVNCPEKNSNPRICKVSPKLVGMLNALPRKSERIFDKTTGKTAQLCLSRARQKVAMKLQSPRINQITHHTLRHWRATMSYHETKDILHVQQLLGHKKIDSTLIYVNLESAIFQTENDNFHVKTATTPEEITQLLEVGFEYVCQKDERVFLRKRK